MPSPNSTQQAVEMLERFKPIADRKGNAFVEHDPKGRFVRLSDVLNALQDVEGEGDNDLRRELERLADAVTDWIEDKDDSIDRMEAATIAARSVLSQPQAGEEEDRG